MAISADAIDTAFRIPDEEKVGIELSMDFHGEAASLDEFMLSLGQLRTCQKIVTAVAALASWMQDADTVPENARKSAEALAKVADTAEEEKVEAALMRLASALTGVTSTIPNELFDIRFEFVGGYRENPTFVRFVARGSLLALMSLILVFGGVQLMKEHGAQACREQQGQFTVKQLELLRDVARRQGRWTGEIVQSHAVVINAARHATLLCGSLLDGFRIAIRTSIGDDFVIGVTGTEPGMVP